MFSFSRALVVGALIAVQGSCLAACVHQYGQTVCQNTQLDHLSRSGLVSVTHLKIKDRLHVHGVLEASHLETSRLSVQGKAHLEDSRVAGAARIQGDLQAKGSHFGRLRLASNHARLDDCQTQTIRVQTNPGDQSVIELVNRTHVHGDVVFDGKQPGLVRLGPQARIQGKVIHGRQVRG